MSIEKTSSIWDWQTLNKRAQENLEISEEIKDLTKWLPYIERQKISRLVQKLIHINLQR